MRQSLPFMLSAMGGNEEHSVPSLPLKEVQVTTLKEVYDRYSAPCPFSDSDIVTPRKGYGMMGEGLPHVVLETGNPPMSQTWPSDPSETASNSFGTRLDMRVASFSERTGGIDAWWVESWKFETYTGEH